MGAKSKTKSCRQPAKAPSQKTCSVDTSSTKQVLDSDLVQNNGAPAGDSEPNSPGPDWHPAEKLTSHINHLPSQSLASSLKNNKSNHWTIRNRPTSNSLRSNISASPLDSLKQADPEPHTKPKGDQGLSH
ncbi:hypothetical protein DSO57_1009313 [Entomophthora muscae]|uniref:Uncharacterized protein n=1 Tax=Entomophthora muscae TaxID=34485 RepID=A0ACC2RLH9_9FUNG|nr:hypothetical protein DSO57_1009313 [Entomophthora muscae]